MSEKILRALLQLFAIIAKADEPTSDGSHSGRSTVERFLKQQFNEDLVAMHLATFDSYLMAYQQSGGKARERRKRTSLNSVKVLKICMQVNEELTQRQKFVVLLRLLEFIHAGGHVAEQELEFVTTVADTFNIAHEEFQQCLSFVQLGASDRQDSDQLLYIDGRKVKGTNRSHHMLSEGLDGELRVLNIPSVNLFLMRYLGNSSVYLNGHSVAPEQHYVLSNGASLRPPNGQPIYYSDIMGCFQQRKDIQRIVFKAESIQLQFPNGRIGLQHMDLAETSGRLIGIMGGSGSGKSTLLNVLNGNMRPSVGRVLINGVDVHDDAELIRGVIGHIPQDDLLIDELTVYQNLFYSAKLCFGDLNDDQISNKVLHLLHSLGLYETKDLRVGSVLDKTISGGQRKRLNIALELIREPSVLFVDEPTSGLSSRDSENIMDLLKELALKGRLIFTVIHQPSSDIFKLFDSLFILDQEGFPVYHGDPVHAVVYFKRIVGHVNCEESQCVVCGNVNPEQIFNILEAKLVDEYGNETDQRRISPQAWNEVYRAHQMGVPRDLPAPGDVPRSTFNAPGVLKQLQVYVTRDLLSKIANTQYVLVNLLEAPVLAFIMAFFLCYYRTGTGDVAKYVFRHNENIPQFLFIAVIVALFMGLTVSAEEIIRDQKILKREKFLHLSRTSYHMSKVAIMFLISAIQTALFVWVGQSILEIKGMFLLHWAVLFSTACFANLLGLNVSASFNSAKVIYILIPVMIIPQLLFSGIIVKFDKLHPWFSSEKSVPFIGNIMASRWAYEALAVTQFLENEHERKFYVYDQAMKSANWKKDLWIRELRNHINEVDRSINGRSDQPSVAYEIGLLRREIEKENALVQGITFKTTSDISEERISMNTLNDLRNYLDRLEKHYRKVYRNAEDAKEDKVATLTATPEEREQYFRVMDTYRNDGLAEVVTNKNDLNVITSYNGELVQKSDPIYLRPVWSSLFTAHFYAPAKVLFGRLIPTIWANVLVLWMMTTLLLAGLHFNVIPRVFQTMTKVFIRPGSK